MIKSGICLLMAEKNRNTEQNIKEAAKLVFVAKGMAGARMQEIADKAGINKALLHYYFRSKQKLFEAVFTEILSKLIPDISELLISELPLFDKIRKFTQHYIDTIRENPLIPVFILHELNREPEGLARTFKSMGVRPQNFVDEINKEIEKGAIIPIDPLQLIVNLLSMCVFPIIAQPIMQHLIFEENGEAYSAFLEQRKKEVPEFIINSIRKK